MTYADFYAAINAGVVAHGDTYTYIGVRYASQMHQVGDSLSPSKHNPDRDDERDFPEYGTHEYDALPDLAGTSCWLVYDGNFDWSDEVDASTVYALRKPHWAKDDIIRRDASHAYLIAGKRCDTHSDADAGEAVIVDAIVIGTIY